MKKSELLEILSELEHNQWVCWSKSISHEISEERVERWKTYWIPYSKLSDDVKEQDRVWARKIIKILEKNGLLKGTNSV